MAGVVEYLDARLDELFQGWNFLSIILGAVLLGFLIYPLVSYVEPDTHPLLLSRQATISPVRLKGESAIYRSPETPYGFPLKSGLNLKEPGAAKWASGRDGDLCDIWRRAVSGVPSEGGEPTGQTGRLLTCFGRENVVDHDLVEISKAINVIGKYIKEQGGQVVAIYLPNSVEFLTAVFAGAFYGFIPVLIPFNQPFDVVVNLLELCEADYLVSAAGSLPLGDLQQKYSGIRETILVVEESSKQMDWTEDNTVLWHEIIEEDTGSTAHLPKSPDPLKNITTIWMQGESAETGELVTFYQKNIVAAVAAQISALPNRHRMGPSDLFFPADSFTAPYMLVLTLAALFSNASIAINSVAGPKVDIALATQMIAPTVIAASADSALQLHDSTNEAITSSAKRYALYSQTRALSSGVMPRKSFLASVNAPINARIGSTPNKLRLLYVFERANSATPPLDSVELSNLRAFTGARVIYALTSPFVAGTVAQTSLYDYRIETEQRGKHSHFGVPVSSIELKVVDSDTHKTTEDSPTGKLVASGPAVANKTANLGITAKFRGDGTLAYA